ncbi:MAG: type I-MYXAN CRISPR-associated protein Cas6/Cmx6 [Deltaproteobacteria bacterium]|nr:type I-MYXAN CRISPR-associated protein Cas6/Cmx6 [Myxococcales bacterium]MDP3216287.1 type I-MYXAN CRISPR-associated protein Cas6/Cmx6 [Deltaproteobacteria bacterium]
MNEAPPDPWIETPARVDLAFPLTGDPVPAEHGYALFSALCRTLGDLHGAAWLAVHPIDAAPEGGGALRLRVDPAQAARVLPLAGATLRLDGARMAVGEARVMPIVPAPTLAARMVVLRNGVAARADFEAALAQRLAALGVRAVAEVPTSALDDGRRVLRIRQQAIAGYPVVLRGLSEQDSRRVQSLGVGGRQRFGCGVFAPR